jgi:thiamine transporter 2/3
MSRNGWKYATGILCAYGFFKEMKPSEPFLNPYLTHAEFKNFSNAVADSEIYPVWTYSYLGFLFIVLFITDYFLYRPLIMTEALAYLSTRILLLWGSSLLAMQFMQFAYGIATATEIAYYSYIYAVVPNKQYKKVTSLTRMAVLLGRTIGWYAGQILKDTHVLSLYQLNFVSFASICVACILVFFLPPVRNKGLRGNCPEVSRCTAGFSKFKQFMVKMRRDFQQIYSNRYLLKWSLWWAFATCGEFQVGNNVQTLWEEIDENKDLNGYAQATATLAGFLVALAVAYCQMNWTVWGEMTLGIISLGDAVVLFVMSQTSSVLFAYGLFLVFRASYTLLITVATLVIAWN